MTVKTTVCFSRTIVWQFKNNNNLSVHKNYPCFFFENKNIHAIPVSYTHLTLPTTTTV